MAEQKLCWYVGYTRSCQEKSVAKSLAALDVEYYLPIQKVRRKWSDRIKIIDGIRLTVDVKISLSCFVRHAVD